MTWAIQLENISKIYSTKYQIKSINEQIIYYCKRLTRKSSSKNYKIVALENLNLSIQKGDIWGVMGDNGAGKSTLLKLLSKITKPTTGKIKINGKVTALLEIGTGFHQELSGRENIYLSGAILGMTRLEIYQKFDEIVSFAGIEDDIDRPVKHYSSGMYLRLAFSVAAHLRNDILLLDEVLAVGDTSFRRKCIDKARNANKETGKTILYVSHHLSSFQGFCNQGLVLSNGNYLFKGNIEQAIETYLKEQQGVQSSNKGEFVLKKNLFANSKIKKIKVYCNNKPNNIFHTGDNFRFDVYITDLHTFQDLHFGFTIKNQWHQNLIQLNNQHIGKKLYTYHNNKTGILKVEIPHLLLYGEGVYFVDFYLGNYNDIEEFIPNAFFFDLLLTNIYKNHKLLSVHSNIFYQANVSMNLKIH